MRLTLKWAARQIANCLMTDNGQAYRSRRFNAVLQREGIKHVYMRPYTPKTNGTVDQPQP
ncbi:MULTISPECIES: DDE-type integrase/transposase/recombinase [Marinobacterium]|uniref:DDE-type integrase/transposase/recombinase n=1 Tax=Marinobacterium TaxID=48075 RepID=UPI001587A8C3|nr:DDE-type integrase/transposase/recombinase [Marinobacterium iners]